MTTFGPHQPGAIRCSDCRFSPGQHGSTCPTTRHLIHKLGAWRRCKAFEAKDRASLAEVPKPLEPWREQKPRWELFRAEFGDLWIGCEPLWSYAWNQASEDEVLEELRQWLRWRRAESNRIFEISRRRASIRSVETV